MKTGRTLMSLWWFLALPAFSIAQTPQPVIARVFYEFKHQYDTLQPKRSKGGVYVLLLGKTSSVYKSYNRVLQDSEMMANLRLSGAMVPPAGKRASGQEFYYYFESKKSFWRNKLMGDYVLEQPFPVLDWKIWDDKKVIQHMACQKATVSYMGRSYIAWFSPDVPFQAGPWKLNGLPGLIITVYDETERIRFDFAGFQQIKNPEEKTAWDDSAIKISWEDYQNLGREIEKDPKAYIEKKFGGTLTTSAPMRHRNPFAPDTTINFPMEISDKRNPIRQTH